MRSPVDGLNDSIVAGAVALSMGGTFSRAGRLRGVRLPHSFRARLGLIAAVAFALRAIWALAVAPTSLNHTGDPRFFHLTANLLVDGRGFIAPVPYFASGTEYPTSEHPPGWSALLAVFSALGG